MRSRPHRLLSNLRLGRRSGSISGSRRIGFQGAKCSVGFPLRRSSAGYRLGIAPARCRRWSRWRRGIRSASHNTHSGRCGRYARLRRVSSEGSPRQYVMVLSGKAAFCAWAAEASATAIPKRYCFFISLLHLCIIWKQMYGLLFKPANVPVSFCFIKEYLFLSSRDVFYYQPR